MSRNAERDCIDAANERDDQRETARREWLESVAAPSFRSVASVDSDYTMSKFASSADMRHEMLTEIATLREALRLANNVLFLLADEVKALGCRAENVPAIVRAALAKAGVV